MSAPVTSERPVDPRVERSRRVIRQAALAELAAAGYGGVTIEAVAARAGVGRTTVYRHWPGKLALIRDALETLNRQPDPAVPAGTARERLEQRLRHLAEVVTDPPLSCCVPALVHAAERDHTLGEFFHGYNARRRRSLVDAIAAGRDSGELPTRVDPELAALALAGAVFYSRLMTPTPLDPDLVPHLIETVLGP